MTAYVISSGVTTGYRLQSGDTLTVQSGGVSMHTSISGFWQSPGEEVVSSGGESLGDRVLGYGFLEVYGSASGAVVSSGGEADIIGSATGMVISSGGQASVEGSAIGTVVGKGGRASIDGSASGTIVETLGLEYLNAGAVTYGDTIRGTRSVAAGATASGGLVSGGLDDVFGSAVSTTIFHATQTVESGGVSNDATLHAGGNIFGEQGSTISGLTISGGEVLTFGLAQAITVIGGSVNLQGGASNVTIRAGGYALVQGANGVTVSSGGKAYLAGILTNAAIEAGGSAFIETSVSTSAVVSSGGSVTLDLQVTDQETLFAAGTAVTIDGVSFKSGSNLAYYTEVMSGGTASAQSGAVISAAYVASGGVLDGPAMLRALTDSGLVSGAELVGVGTISATGVGEAMRIDSGGKLVVSANGLLSQTTVLSGAQLVLRSGATAQAVTVNAGGEVTMAVLVGSGQTFTVSGDKVNAATSLSGVTIQSGGLIDLSTLAVKSGGTVSVAAGATVHGISIPKGATLIGPGAIGGTGASFDNGLVEGVHLQGAANLTVGATGVASGVVLEGSGGMTVNSGGVADGTVVSVFAVQSVTRGAVVSGTAVQNGGALWLGSGATTSGSVVSNGGSAFFAGLTLSHGDTMVYSAGGDVATTEAFGGMTFKAGAVIALEGPVNIKSGATLSLGAGAQLVLSTPYPVSAALTVSAGGVLAGPGSVVLSGYAFAVFDRGLVSGVSLNQLEVMSGGVSQRIVGGETVLAGGHSISALITSSETVSSGGVASSTVVSGGVEDIRSGGLASNTTVSVGSEIVEKGGVVYGLSLLSGSLQDNGFVRVGASPTFLGAITGSGTLAVAGLGHLTLSGADSEFKGLAVISGGTMEAGVAKALGAARVVFAAPAASATLQIDAADAPAPGDAFMNTLSNFNRANDTVDLRSIAFVAGATAVVSGSQLVITDGGATYGLNLQGGVAGSYAVTDDGHGGTLVNPVAAGFAQALAAFTGAKGAAAPPVSGGASGRSQPLFAAAGSAGGG